MSAFTADMSMSSNVSTSSPTSGLTVRNDKTVETFSYDPSTETYKESSHGTSGMGIRSTIHIIPLVQIPKESNTLL